MVAVVNRKLNYVELMNKSLSYLYLSNNIYIKNKMLF